MSEEVKEVIVACVPIAVALVGIIPTIIANRIKTQKTIKDANQGNTNELNDIKGSVSDIKDDITELREQLKGHIKEDQWEKMKQSRIRIIRFADELSQDKTRFSKAHFDEIIDDIDIYEKFCDEHKDFENNKGKACMEFIKRVNQELMDSDGFAR